MHSAHRSGGDGGRRRSARCGPTTSSPGTHRSHHITLAKGMPADEVMAELFGKAGGRRSAAAVGTCTWPTSRPRSLRLERHRRCRAGDRPRRGAWRLGAAGTTRSRSASSVTAASTSGGCGSSSNLASVWRLPLVIVCENNLYAVETPYSAGHRRRRHRRPRRGLRPALGQGRRPGRRRGVPREPGRGGRARAGDGPSLHRVADLPPRRPRRRRPRRPTARREEVTGGRRPRPVAAAASRDRPPPACSSPARSTTIAERQRGQGGRSGRVRRELALPRPGHRAGQRDRPRHRRSRGTAMSSR